MPKDWFTQEDDDFLTSIELESLVKRSLENIAENSSN